MRASGSDDAVILTPAIRMTLEECISYINDDELVEITPASIRLRNRSSGISRGEGRSLPREAKMNDERKPFLGEMRGEIKRPAQPEAVPGIIEFVCSHAHDMTFGEKRIEDLRLALGETLATSSVLPARKALKRSA